MYNRTIRNRLCGVYGKIGIFKWVYHVYRQEQQYNRGQLGRQPEHYLYTQWRVVMVCQKTERSDPSVSQWLDSAVRCVGSFYFSSVGTPPSACLPDMSVRVVLVIDNRAVSPRARHIPGL